MSLNVIPLDITPMIDPRINVNNKRSYSILKGPSIVTYRQFPSTSYSSSSINFSCTPPNSQTLICSNIYIQMTFDFYFTGTSTSPPLLKTLYDCPASFPIAKSINNMTITLNNSPISYNYSDIFPWLFRYEGGCSELNRFDLSSSVDMLDEHNDLNSYTSLGTGRSPFSLYGENATLGKQSRNAFSYEIITNTATEAHVRLTVIEPLFLPSLLNFNDEKLTPSLVNISTNDYVFTMNTNLKNLWSHASGSPNTITDINVVPNQSVAPQLMFCYITTDYLSILPPSIVLPYAQIDRYQQNVGTLTAGNSTTVYLNNIQLKVIPKCMYIFARESNASLSEISTDCFMSITNLSIDFCNRTALLSSASQFDLWKISRKNGLNMTFDQFKKYIGSCICLYTDEDIGSNSAGGSLEVAGVSGTFQLQIRANITNTFNRDVNLTFYVIVINEGTATISNGMTILSNSVVSKEDVYKAITDSDAMTDYSLYRDMSGRGIVRNIGDVIRKTNRWLNRKAIPAISGVAKTVDSAREAVGEVMGTSGSGLVGGQVLSREKLRQNMRKLI